ncbi:SRPBCC family protein [Arthrobacter sp. U41]|uniref:SRPBCC family protein n=1 Tax=Arthrobacter sp. U41 TaxID=1849032 RepID=UPI0009F62B93
MTSIHGEIVIGRPPSEVFDFVADERNEPRYNPRILRVEKVTGGAIGNGTQFKVTTTSRRRLLTMLLETTEYHRPTRLANTTSMSSATILGVLTFEPEPGDPLAMVVGHPAPRRAQVPLPGHRPSRQTPGSRQLGKPQTLSGINAGSWHTGKRPALT